MTAITKKAVKILQENKVPSTGPTFVYFVAGLPDVTTKLESILWLHRFSAPYQEVIFPEKPQSAANRVIAEFRRTNNIIKQHNAIPVFGTVAPINIEDWNRERLRQQKTAVLNHTAKYRRMQRALTDTIKIINSALGYINKENCVATPKLAEKVTARRRSDKSLRVLKRKFVRDGVHLKKRTKSTWVSCLKRVIKKNRDAHTIQSVLPSVCEPSSTSDDSDSEQKRSWRTY